MLTIPDHAYTMYLPPNCSWIKGQREVGEGGFQHWQLICAFKSKASLAAVRSTFGPYHGELSRSELASEYVWKDDTAVEGTR